MGFLAAKLGKQPSLDEVNQAIASAKDQLVKIAQPSTLYLFGSAANGTFTNTSDLDFLLVFKDLEALKAGRARLSGHRYHIQFPIDLVFVTEEHFHKQSNIGGVCMVAKEQGKCLYD